VKGDKQEEERTKVAIAKHVSDQKIRYKWLDGGVFFIDTIPKNPSGKILRRLLKGDAKMLREEALKLKAKL